MARSESPAAGASSSGTGSGGGFGRNLAPKATASGRSVENHVQELNSLFDRSGNPNNYPAAEVDRAMRDLNQLSHEDLQRVANGFGITRLSSAEKRSKTAIIRRIRNKIDATKNATIANRV